MALTDPLTQRPAFWIPHCAQASARQLRYTVISSDRVLPRYLRHIIYTHADQLLSRQDVHALLADLAQRAPLLVAELIGYDPRHQPLGPDRSNDNSKLSVAQIHKVLQELLAQGIPICDLESILEALSDALAVSCDPAEMTSRVRCSLAPTITRQFTASDGRLHCLRFEPSAERTLNELLHRPRINGFAGPPGQQSLTACLSNLVDSIVDYLHALPVLPEPLVFLVASEIRPALARVLAGRVPTLPVLARSEILENAPIHTLASFSLPQNPIDRPALLTQQTLELLS
ncbi:Flagellar biosynthesis protein FlhA [subsurface metagenome]